MVDAVVVSFTESGPQDQGQSIYFPVLEYVYEGKTYRTNGNEGVANALEVGKVFTIFINPDKPGESFLSLVLKIFGYFMVFCAILMTVLDYFGL